MKRFFKAKIRTLLEDAIKELDHYDNIQSELWNRVEELEKSKGITDKEEALSDLYNRSLYVFSDKEIEQNKAFRSKHYHSCSNGNNFGYLLSYTGFSTGIEIFCLKCGEKKDITDTSNW